MFDPPSGSATATLTGDDHYYVGSVTLGSGQNLAFGAGTLSEASSLTIDGQATLQWAAGNTDSLSGLPITVSGSATLDTDGNDVTLKAPIGGAGSLVKTGDGTLVLATENDYAGTTTIAAGCCRWATARRRLDGHWRHHLDCHPSRFPAGL